VPTRRFFKSEGILQPLGIKQKKKSNEREKGVKTRGKKGENDLLNDSNTRLTRQSSRQRAVEKKGH